MTSSEPHRVSLSYQRPFQFPSHFLFSFLGAAALWFVYFTILILGISLFPGVTSQDSLASRGTCNLYGSWDSASWDGFGSLLLFLQVSPVSVTVATWVPTGSPFCTKFMLWEHEHESAAAVMKDLHCWCVFITKQCASETCIPGNTNVNGKTCSAAHVCSQLVQCSRRL